MNGVQTTTESHRHPLHGLLVNLMLLLALVLLFVGLTTPVLTLEKYYVFSNTVTLWSALELLAAEGDWGMVLLLGGFSVVFPIIKILWLLLIWNFETANSARHRRHLHWLSLYSRWSMLDVFVVALLVVSVKLGGVAQTRIESGVYIFAASVILVMLVSAWMGRYQPD